MDRTTHFDECRWEPGTVAWVCCSAEAQGQRVQQTAFGDDAEAVTVYSVSGLDPLESQPFDAICRLLTYGDWKMVI